MNYKRKRSRSTGKNKKPTDLIKQEEIKEEIELVLEDYDISNSDLADTTSDEFYIAKLLDLNIILLVCDKDTWASNEMNLNIVRHDGTEHLAVIFDSGDYSEMESTIKKLVAYEQKLTQYNNNRYTSQGVQTEYVRIEPDGEHAPKTEERTYTLLQTTLDLLLGACIEPQKQGRTDELDKPDKDIVTVDMTEASSHAQESNCRDGSLESDTRAVKTTLPKHKVQGHEQVAVDMTEASSHAQESNCRDGSLESDTRAVETTLPKHEVQGQKQGDVVNEKRKRSNHYCIFCKKIVNQLPRHLLRKHAAEDRVKAFLSLPLKDKRRFSLLTRIRREGNAAYNEVLRKEGKTIIPVRTSKEKIYCPCPHCSAFYSRKSLSRHYGSCSGKKVPKILLSMVPEIYVNT